MKNVGRLALVKPEMELITKRWKALGGYSAPPQASEKYQQDLKRLFEKYDCSPGRSMIGVVVQVLHMSCVIQRYQGAAAELVGSRSIEAPGAQERRASGRRHHG
jgi:hypothetical protein